MHGYRSACIIVASFWVLLPQLMVQIKLLPQLNMSQDKAWPQQSGVLRLTLLIISYQATRSGVLLKQFYLQLG
ncbi:hypothetical protein BDA96_10G038700 [Sorghum bicolor]|uniref:Uncharacterized protein n=2 Tax=Sorghum bicolor TaxID=4558 RepID=A0A921TZW8_SORBI|nr:hypothetical protein BDA96_10G038700 [Sorghum bicolor]OQU75804.1 hypothetical protein SORBI_3010G033750 [Sorghum bicolor]